MTENSTDEIQAALLQGALDTVQKMVDAGIPARLALEIVSSAIREGERDLSAILVHDGRAYPDRSDAVHFADEETHVRKRDTIRMAAHDTLEMRAVDLPSFQADELPPSSGRYSHVDHDVVSEREVTRILGALDTNDACDFAVLVR